VPARSILRTLVLAFALTTVASAAHADDVTPESAPNDAAAREKSRAAFRRGVLQLRSEDWAGARASFEEAWALFQHPSILLNLGIAHLRTGDPVLAEQDLVRFLSEDPGAASDELAAARETLNEARSKIGTVRVVVAPASARVVVDKSAVPVRTSDRGDGGVAEARVAAGKHAIVVSADGYRERTVAVDVAGKTDTEAKIALTPAEDTKPKAAVPSTTRKVVGWSLVGLSGLAIGATTFMGLRAMSLSNDYGDRKSPSFQDHDVKSEGISFRTGADVALGTAIVAGAVAFVLLATDVGLGGGDVARVGVSRLGSGAPAQPLLRW
jgi:hypothetical protein